MNPDKPKIDKRCPCVYTYINKRDEKRTVAPTVDCSFKCSTCGWNPAEQKRRLAYGLQKRPHGGLKLVFKGSEV